MVKHVVKVDFAGKRENKKCSVFKGFRACGSGKPALGTTLPNQARYQLRYTRILPCNILYLTYSMVSSPFCTGLHTKCEMQVCTAIWRCRLADKLHLFRFFCHKCRIDAEERKLAGGKKLSVIPEDINVYETG